MKILDKDLIYEKAKQFKNIIVVGDVHGKFGELGFRIKQRYQITDSIIIIAGDFGVGFHKPEYYKTELRKLNRICCCTNNLLFVVRGNHDDPAYFDGNFGMSNLKLVPDYTVIETTLDNILCVGGGTSIDRKHRKLGVSYWTGEQPIFDETKLSNCKPPSIVVTHTAPSFVFPTGKPGIGDWLKLDPALHEDLAYERLINNKIYDYLVANNKTPGDWIYGHFHGSCKEKFENTSFKLCDELEFHTVV